MTAPKAKAPAATPLASAIAIIVAIGLLASAAIAGREFLIERNAISGRPWIRDTFEWISRISWQNWMLPAAIAALVVGALLLLAALKPRAKTHIETNDQPTLWLRPTDVARMSTAAALRVPDVLHARTVISHRTATVRVTTDADDTSGIRDSVRSRVGDQLAHLAKPLTVKVSVERGQTQ